jgi:hypothetical protein
MINFDMDIFKVDGIVYRSPSGFLVPEAVYVRPMFEIVEDRENSGSAARWKPEGCTYDEYCICYSCTV